MLVHGHSRVAIAMLRRAAQSVRRAVRRLCPRLGPRKCRRTACCCRHCCPSCAKAGGPRADWLPTAAAGPRPTPAASLQGKQFSVIVTEGRPDETGLTMARVLEEMRVPTTVVLDSAVGYVMER